MTTTERLGDLRAKLKARKDKPEYHENVRAIESEIERLEYELSQEEKPKAKAKK